MTRAALSLAETLGVLSFTPANMLQACAQAVDFKVGVHFGEGQGRTTTGGISKTYREASARTSINLNNDAIAAHRDKRLPT